MMGKTDDEIKDELLQQLMDQMDERDAKRLPGMDRDTEDVVDEKMGDTAPEGDEPSQDLSDMDPRLLELLKKKLAVA